MPPKTKPSSADWEKQKEPIRRLYLGKDLTLHAVRRHLEDDGFTATKAQFEAKFKEWGFSKNVPVNIWKHVGFKIGKRKREGKDSTVSINGIEIPIKRVKKETSRHYYSAIERAEFEKINAPSPPGSFAVISTPPIQQEVLIVERWPSNLPWFSFIRFLDTRLEGQPRTQLNPQSYQGGLTFAQKKSQANDILVEQSRTEIPGGRQLVLDTIKEYAPSDLNYALLPFSSDVEWPAEINSRMSLESISSNHWGLKMLIYLSSNKLLESSNIDTIWRMIESTGIKQLADFSDPSFWKQTSLEATMECLFEFGIKRVHAHLVRWLLNAGLEPNTKLKLESAETEAHLPLIVALSSGDSDAREIVRLLLFKGSSPVLICCEEHGSPIQFLIENCKEEDDKNWFRSFRRTLDSENRKAFWDVFSKIMETLNQHPKTRPLRYGDEFKADLSALWKTLIDEDSIEEDLTEEDLTEEDLTEEDLPEEDSTETNPDMDQDSDDESPDIYQLIKLVEAVKTRISNPGASVISPTSLIRAVENQHEGLIRFMHEHGQEMDCYDRHGRFPLLAAFEISDFDHKRYMSNIKLLLELGASTNYDPSWQTHGNCSPALQAAVYSAADGFNIAEAIQLLVQHGASAQGLPTCGGDGHLSLVDCARSQVDWHPQELTEVLISLHRAGLSLPEWSLISILDLAYRNDGYEHAYDLCEQCTMLFETAPGIRSNLSLRSELDWTALDYAVFMDQQRLAQLLVRRGAKHMSRSAYLHLLAGNFSTDAVENIMSRLRQPRKVEQSRDMMFHNLIGILRVAQPMDHQDAKEFSDLIRQYCKMPRSSEQEAYIMYEACSSGQAELITIAMEMLPNTYSSAAFGALVQSWKLTAEDRWMFIHRLLGRRPNAPLGWSTETQMFIIIIDEALRAGGDGRILELFTIHDRKLFKNANVHSSEFALQFFARESIELLHMDGYVTRWLIYGLEPSPYLGIMIACTGLAEKMSALLEHGFQANRRLCWSPTPLQIAVIRGDRPMTLRLLEAGCDVNARPPWRDIPKSIYNRIQDDILKVLAPHSEQTRRRTALQLAVEEGNTSFVKVLLNFEANVNGQPARVGGATALQVACIKRYIEIARLLISKGADVNAPGAEYFGRTALEGAAENGRLDIVCLLFERGCRVDGCFRRQYIRAVGLAKAQGNYALTKFLQDFGEWKKADEDSLKEIELDDEEPDSRDLEEDLQEDDDISEVDAAEFEFDVDALPPYEPSEESDSADHSKTSHAENTTPSVNHVSLEVTNSSNHPEQLIRLAETEYTDWDKLIDYYVSQDEELL